MLRWGTRCVSWVQIMKGLEKPHENLAMHGIGTGHNEMLLSIGRGGQICFRMIFQPRFEAGGKKM